MNTPGEILAVIETAIYVDDLDAAEAFYGGVLGLEAISRESGRHVFFRVGTGVLLAFDPEATLKGDVLPPHGEGAGALRSGCGPTTSTGGDAGSTRSGWPSRRSGSGPGAVGRSTFGIRPATRSNW